MILSWHMWKSSIGVTFVEYYQLIYFGHVYSFCYVTWDELLEHKWVKCDFIGTYAAYKALCWILPHHLSDGSLFCATATRYTWRKSRLRWKRTADQYPSWPASHTACHCQAMSVIWRKIFPRRSWSRMHPINGSKGRDFSQISPRALSLVWRGKTASIHLREKRGGKKRIFF